MQTIRRLAEQENSAGPIPDMENGLGSDGIPRSSEEMRRFRNNLFPLDGVSRPRAEL